MVSPLVPETLFEEMKRYVRFGEEDEARLRALGPLAEPHLPRIAREFYDRIREHEQAHAVFTGEAQIERLQGTLVLWMRKLLAGPHDEAYFLERAKIGRTHVRIGLPQRYMFTAMALIRVALQRVTNAVAVDEREPTREALDRALDVELAIMVETYCDDFAERLARIERAEQERLLAVVARNERRYADAVELARLLVIGIDVEGNVGLFNQEAERVTGRRAIEIAGRPVGELFVAGSAGEVLLRFARGSQPLPEEWRMPVTTLAGHERLVVWRLARVADAPVGEVVLIATGHDVTEDQSREQRARRAENLAAVGTLAAGLAHEIRNPLNGAMLHVTFLDRALKKEGANEESLASVKFIGDEIQRLSDLVSEFLVFARPSTLTLRPTSIHTLCRHAISVVESDAAAAHATVRLDLSTSDVVAAVDESRVEQVLLNLLRNAIDAVGSAGGGQVTVRERRRPRAVQLEIEDDGPGIPRADAPVFDAFYTTKATGTGLGLSIVHRIVTDHGGTVGFESAPGRTVFQVVLPVGAGDGGPA